MASFDVSLQEALQQGICNTLAIAENTAGLGSQFYGAAGLRGASQTSAQAAQMWGNAAGVFCNRPPQNIAEDLGPEIIGGQCNGTSYTFNLSYDVAGAPSFSEQGIVGVGPINIITRGLDFVLTATDGVSGLTTGWRQFGEYTIGFTEIISNINLEITSGSPDDCGNQDPAIPPYDENTFTVPTTFDYTDTDGNMQTENVTNVFGPVRVTPTGEFVVPVSIDFGDGSQLFGDINFSTGDITIGGGNSGDGGVSGPEREKDPDEPLAPGEIIVGVRVVVNNFDPNVANVTEIFTGTNSPALLLPRVATILFQYNTSVGNGWSDATDSKTEDSIIYSERPARDARVLFRPGVTGSYTLIVTTEVECCGT